MKKMEPSTPSFQTLSADTGIALPPLLQVLLASGKTAYGPDWPETWRARCLGDPPALISCFDFEWIDAAESRKTIAEWLNPAFQSDRRFLPFAQSGAGDRYCLMSTDAGEAGVALIWHDAGESVLGHGDFSGFVCTRFLATFSDLGHLLDDGFTEQEAIGVVRADVHQVARHMVPAIQDYLLGLCSLEPAHRPFLDGPRSRPRSSFSLISQERLVEETRRFPPPGLPPFPVVSRWDVPRTPVAPPAITWRTLALDPARKMQAIRAYQAEHGVDLSAAKAAVERHAAESRGGV